MRRWSGARSRCSRPTRSTSPARPASSASSITAPTMNSATRRCPTGAPVMTSPAAAPSSRADVGAEHHLAVGQHAADGLAVQPGGRARVAAAAASGYCAPGGGSDVPAAACGNGGHAERAAVEQRPGAAVGRSRERRGLHRRIEVARLRDRDARRDRSGARRSDRRWTRRGHRRSPMSDDGGDQGPPPREGDAGRRAGAARQARAVTVSSCRSGRGRPRGPASAAAATSARATGCRPAVVPG